MPQVSHTSVIDVGREQVFAYINDHANVPKFMFGITTFDALTEQTEGKGSRFVVAMNVGPKTLKSTVETVDWVENELIDLKSIEGFVANTTWRFADADGGTKVDVLFSYELPGGLAGRALGVILEPFIGQAVKQTESNLRSQLA